MEDLTLRNQSNAAAGGGGDKAGAAAAGENVSVSIRVRPMNEFEKERRYYEAWKPLEEVPGHIQQYEEGQKPVPNATYAFGAWSAG